ncbi:HlyD family secretion protein [Nostoc sp. 'Peltigera membranacea cyanobiont' 232]|uniref:HlyD family secretion protein n=1 Tax=Nostoc sp. 'Peltigera membranacea cyanobiont' 232 TaxID=2014531 RepID=UPI001CB96C0F|nr:HlyD family efflux transporter periplasmic adaptor subunit [Nostoc sp. 'Peltigera membranacea cyanobiont' 232]
MMTQIQTDPQNDSQKPDKAVKEREPAQVEQPTKPNSVEEKEKQKPWQKIPKPIWVIGAVLLLAGVGYGVYRLFFYSPDAAGLSLSGRIEGYETDVSAKIGGRVAQVSAREGDTVKSGQILVQIDDSDLRAQLQGAIARVRAAEERLQSARQQLPVLQAQLEQASLTTNQSTQDSQGRVLEAENAVDQARSNLAEAQANLVQAQSKQRRTSRLYAEGAVAAQQLDDDNAILGANQAKVSAAQQQVKSAGGRLTQAQATQQNTPIRAAAELQVQKQIDQAKTDTAVSQHEVRDALATQAQIQANLNYLVIKSPIAGDVITRSIEPGEVVAAGAPLLTLVNQQKLYLRGFVEEGQIGQVKLGQRAQVYLDSFPDQPLEATISRIDPKASFTPENTYFKKDRVTQVFGVELTLNNNAQGKAKQGMPADGRILLPESEPKRSSTLMPDRIITNS